MLPQRGDVDAGGLTARGGGGRRAWQVPTDHQPVGVTGAVDAVAHRPVEVGEVARRTGAELGQVEMRVPPDQGIERPGDQRDVLAQRPGALVQFEGEPDAPAEASRRDPGDVTVQARLGRAAEEAEAGSQKLVPFIRPRDIVPRRGHRPQQLGRHRLGTGARLPDRGEEPADLGQVGHLGQVPDFHT